MCVIVIFEGIESLYSFKCIFICLIAITEKDGRPKSYKAEEDKPIAKA